MKAKWLRGGRTTRYKVTRHQKSHQNLMREVMFLMRDLMARLDWFGAPWGRCVRAGEVWRARRLYSGWSGTADNLTL